MRTLTYDIATRLLDADFATGSLTWKQRSPDLFQEGARTRRHSCNQWNSRHAGKAAFITVEKNGYMVGNVFRKTYKAHRVLWLLAHGSWPNGEIDHINGVRTDNRSVNLRDVSRAENQQNRVISKSNKTGVMGVTWHKGKMKWQVSIGKRSIGHFADFDLAVERRLSAQLALSYHENHGRLPDERPLG